MNRRVLIALVILIVVVAACGSFVIVNYYSNQPHIITDPQELYKQTGIVIRLNRPAISQGTYWWESFTNLVMHRTIGTPAGNVDAEVVVFLSFSNATPVPNEVDASVQGLILWYPQQGWPFSSPSYGDTLTVCESNPPPGSPPPFQCGLNHAHNAWQSFGFGVVGAIANQTYTLRLQMKYANSVILFETPLTATGFIISGFLGS
jgi:hypothetical protein